MRAIDDALGQCVPVRSSYGGARPQRDFPLLAQACLESHLKLAPCVISRIGRQDINVGMGRLRKGGRGLTSVLSSCAN